MLCTPAHKFPLFRIQGEQLRDVTLSGLQKEDDRSKRAMPNEEECQIHVAPKTSQGGTAELDWVFQFDQSTRYTHMGMISVA